MWKTGPELERSGAGWSEPGRGEVDGDAPVDDPFAAPGGERYVELDQLGAGGMGEVALVRDRRLGRELAYKRLPDGPADERARRRLAREARTTAALDHPGIVAIYDAGVDDDGRPYFTMRAVRGRSLAARLAAPLSAEQRRTLVRQLLAAAEAMAYAHERGVVHRDLTPANIMIGDFGEVQIVDWGLAIAIGAGRGDRAGTPAYMSPERRGDDPAAAAPAADVWAMGTMLAEVVGATARAPELAAIIAKATAPTVERRYRDAGALADDLRRYHDGRPVAAYTYSAVELLRRALWTWRWPLASLGAALAIASVIAVGAWQRVRHERNRAVDAEQLARIALDDARASLGRALASRAVLALEEHAVAEAEVLAARSLRTLESPEARGVLAATRAVIAPREARHDPLPACVTVLDAADDDALCVEGGDLIVWSRAARQVRVRLPGVPHDAYFGPAGSLIVVRFGAGVEIRDRVSGALRSVVSKSRRPRVAVDVAGPRALAYSSSNYLVVDLRDGQVEASGEVCAAPQLEQLALAGDRLAAVCRDQTVWTARRGEAWRQIGALAAPNAPDTDAATALALRDDGALAIGTSRGWLWWGSVDRWDAARAEEVRTDRVAQLAWLGERLVVRGDRGGALVWATDGSGARLRLPAAGNRRVRVDDDRVLAIGRGVWSWRLPDDAGEPGWQNPAGLTSLAIAPDGGAIAATVADGTVSVRDAMTGAVTRRAIDPSPLKQGAFTADGGALILAAAAREPLRRLDLATGAVTAMPTSVEAVVRLGVTTDGAITSFHYGGRRVRWHRGVATTAFGPEIIDVATTGAGLLALTADGELAEVSGDAWRSRERVPGATAATTIGDDVVAIARTGVVELRRGGAATTRFAVADVAILDLAASPDRRWLAGATTDGAILVWDLDREALVATLRGHTQRVAAVTFDRLGRLWSASWDGAVRAWDVAAFDALPGQVDDEVAARWAITVDDVR